MNEIGQTILQFLWYKILQLGFLWFWGGITAVFILFSFPKNIKLIKNQPVQVGKLVIRKEKGRLKEIWTTIKILFICIIIGFLTHLFLKCCKGVHILAMVKGYERWFYMFIIPLGIALVPVLVTSENNTKVFGKTGWVIIALFAGVLPRIGCDLNNLDKICVIENNRSKINIFFSVTFSLIVFCIIEFLNEFIKELKAQSTKKVKEKNIRDDLFYRTPNAELFEYTSIELVEKCEKYFLNYLRLHEKINKLKTIELVTLAGRYQEQWAKRVAKRMKYFWGITLLISIINLFSGQDKKVALGLFVILLVYALVIHNLKRKEQEYLGRLTIRLGYSEWGYYMTYKNGNKFTARVQLFNYSKYHKFLYELLNFTAFCRGITFLDVVNHTKNIEIITDNMNELCSEFFETNHDNWTRFLPLWIASIFEYKLEGKLRDNVKKRLAFICDNYGGKLEINLFLYGFWLNINGKEPGEDINNFVTHFMQSFSS